MRGVGAMRAIGGLVVFALALVLALEQLGDPIDQLVDRLVDLGLDLLDDAADLVGDAAEAEQVGEQADRDRNELGERGLDVVGGAADVAGDDVADRVDHRLHQPEDPLGILLDPLIDIPRGLDQLDDRARRIPHRGDLDDRLLHDLLDQPVLDAADDGVPQAGHVLLDLVPQARHATGDQRLDVARDKLEPLGVLLADDLDDLAAQPGPGQAHDLAGQVEDAGDVERRGHRDAGRGERAEQPLHHAVFEVGPEVLAELLKAELDGVDQVADERARIGNDLLDRIFRTADQRVERRGVDPEQLEHALEDHLADQRPVASDRGLREGHRGLHRGAEHRDHRFDRALDAVAQRGDRGLEAVGDRGDRLCGEVDGSVDQRVELGGELREHLSDQRGDGGLEPVAKLAERGAHEVAGGVDDLARHVLDRVEQLADRVADLLERVVDGVADRLDVVADRVDRLVPPALVATGLVVGRFLLVLGVGLAGLLLVLGLLGRVLVVALDLGLVGLDARIDLAERALLLGARLLVELLDLVLLLDEGVGLLVGDLAAGLGDLGLLLLVGVGVGLLDLGLGVVDGLGALGVALDLGLGHLGLGVGEVAVHLGLGDRVERALRIGRQVPLLELRHPVDHGEGRELATGGDLGHRELGVELGGLDLRRALAADDLGLLGVECLGAVGDRVLLIAQRAHRVALAGQIGDRRGARIGLDVRRGRREGVDDLLAIHLELRLVGPGLERGGGGRAGGDRLGGGRRRGGRGRRGGAGVGGLGRRVAGAAAGPGARRGAAVEHDRHGLERAVELGLLRGGLLGRGRAGLVPQLERLLRGRRGERGDVGIAGRATGGRRRHRRQRVRDRRAGAQRGRRGGDRDRRGGLAGQREPLVLGGDPSGALAIRGRLARRRGERRRRALGRVELDHGEPGAQIGLGLGRVERGARPEPLGRRARQLAALALGDVGQLVGQ